ncbi:MAG: leucyl aminopeptidase [Ferrovum sp.]|nr:leucyl aminopeptidase [Ferrovum sp.]NDU87125.1 leucyl aminopeptidase [Ferrovum sp.]
MEFTLKAVSPETAKTGCVVIPVTQGRCLTASAQALDQACEGQLSRVLKCGDLPAETGKTLLLHGLQGITAPRILLVETGEDQRVKESTYRAMVRAVAQNLDTMGSKDALLCLTELEVVGRNGTWVLEQTVLTLREQRYRIPKQTQEPRPVSIWKKTILLSPAGVPPKEAQAIIGRAQAVANGMDLTRDLGNLPPNLVTPTYLADVAQSLGKEWDIKVRVLDRQAMEKLGMGALLAVSAGSHQPPRFIIMEYAGAGNRKKPVVLVGKGITFDTGGISLKPAPEMDEMKFDMCGAASVLGTMRAVAEMKLPLNLVVLVPTCENMPGGGATRPGDVVQSLSGQTIEILNTDAEGRLILCDALTYAERFNPEAVIDVATLTGACVIALGHEAAGLMGNDDELRQALQSAGDYSGDRAWPLPLWEEYQEGLKSNFADMANIAGRPAGTITAASFLARFTKKYSWAHLDIAGVAWRSGKEKGATGRPVKLFCRYLIERALG